MPIKGALFRHLLYADPAAHPAMDIDLLIRPGDVERVERALVEEGYTRVVVR